MMNNIMKIFNFLSAIPSFTKIFTNAKATGVIDPVAALDCLSSVSPGTKKCSDAAMNAVQRGGNFQDAVLAIKNVGEIDVLGQKIDTRNIVPQLKNAGGVCSVLANMLEKFEKSPDDVLEFGNAATQTSNWGEILNSARG